MNLEPPVTDCLAQLNLPKQVLTELRDCKTSIDGLQHWIDHLPKAHLDDLSLQLLSFFQQFNRLKLQPKKRLQFLELLRPQTYFTLQELRKRYQHNSLELSLKQRQAAKLAQALQNQLAIGYKHLLLEPLANNKNVQALVLHRALTELGQCYLRASILHCPTPRTLWFELHQLFLWGHQQQLLQHKITDTEHPTPTQTSIVENYKRTLLFGLSNQEGLRGSELQQIFTACSHWSHTVHLVTAPGAGRFAINLNADRPPCDYALLSAQPNQCLWLLDTQPLCDLLSNNSNLVLSQPLDKRSRQHLIRAWGAMTSRSAPRQKARGQLQLAIGFRANHYYLAGKTLFKDWLDNQELDWRQRFQHEMREGEAWKHAFDASSEASGAIEQSDIHFTGAAESTEPSLDELKLFNAELIDKSASGFKILIPGTLPPRLQAGELLSIKAAETNGKNSKPWNLTVICWLKRQGKQGVQAGLQRLPTNIRLGAIASQDASGEYSHYMRCFLIPDEHNREQFSSLLVPRISFKNGDKVRLVENGTTFNGNLSDPITQNACFSHFHFEHDKKTSHKPDSDIPTELTLAFDY